MNKEQTEILNRVKLFMNYDNKKTLSENVQTILNEQYAANNEKLWQLVNNNDQNAILDYACQLKNMSFRNLVNLWKIMAPKTGVITPDLDGFGTFNRPTAASVILENEIYLRRKKNENNFSEILIPLKEILSSKKYGFRAKDTSNQLGKTAVMPESTLLSAGKVDPVKGGFIGNTVIFANRPATQICDEQRILPKATPKEKKQTEVGMDFSKIPDRKTMFDKFKFYYEKKNPGQKFQTNDLRIKGLNKDKYGIPSEQEVKKYIEMNWQYPSDEGANIYDVALSVGYNKTQAKQILKKFGTQNEKGEIYWNDRTKKENKKEELKKQEEESNQELNDKQQDLVKNKLVLRVFPNAAELIKDDDCKKQYLKFFQAVIDGSVKNKNNKIVGKAYYNSKGQIYYAKWNEKTPPCSDEWWDEYGMYVQIGGLIAISLLTAGLGAIPSTLGGIIRASSAFINIAADTALNLYSLKQAVKSQDEDRIKMEYLYLFLPLAFESNAVKNILQNSKLGKNTIQSVEKKMASLGSNPNPNSVKQLISNMTEEEKLVIKELGDEKYKNALEIAGKDFIDRIKLTPRVTGAKSLLRYISNPLIYVAAYGSPAAIYLTAEIKKAMTQKVGTSFNIEEERLWQIALSYLSQEDMKKVASTLTDVNILEKYDDLLKNPKTAELKKAINSLYGDDPNVDYQKVAEDLNKKMQEFVFDLGEASGQNLNPLPEPEPIENTTEIQQIISKKNEPPKKQIK